MLKREMKKCFAFTLAGLNFTYTKFMQNTSEINTNADQKLGQLKAILYLLQTHLEEFKNEVDRSYALLQLGEMTDLTKKIEGTLSNPVDSVFSVAHDIDSQIKQIVDLFVQSFIRKNKTIVDAAYRSKTPLNDLHYSIVLKEDNIDNRNKLFDFFDSYDLLEIANKYPVYFQFIPTELKNNISYTEALKID